MESNLEDKITDQTLVEHLLESLKSKGDPKEWSNQFKALMEHAAYRLSKYDHLTPEAQKQTNELSSHLLGVLEQQFANVPDSPEVRKARRLMRGAKGKRLIAKLYINVLESPTTDAPTLYKKTNELFEKHLQVIMDLYQDIANRTANGPSEFCKMSLVGVCIDELLVTHHLAQRSYAAQGLSHLRTAHEALGLMELFEKDPQWIDLWTSGKPWQEIWEKLGPRKVMGKLNKDKVFGNIYAMFSDMGSHPSFEMLRNRARTTGVTPKGNPKILLSIGGTPQTKEAIFVHVFLLMTMIMLLTEISKTFYKDLNEEELIKALKDLVGDFTDLVTDNLIKPLDESQATAMRQSISNLRDNVFKEIDEIVKPPQKNK